MKAGCSFRMSLLCRFSTSIVGVTSDKKIFIKVRILSLNESFGHDSVPSCLVSVNCLSWVRFSTPAPIFSAFILWNVSDGLLGGKKFLILLEHAASGFSVCLIRLEYSAAISI